MHETSPRTALVGRRVTSALVVALALATLPAACANDGAATSASTTSQGAAPSTPATTIDVPAGELKRETGVPTVAISAIDNNFEPRYIEITAGAKVTFTNDGRNTHSITPAVAGSFTGASTQEFAPGSVHVVTFDKPGEYLYFGSIHGTPRHGQNGVIRVVAKS